MNTAIKYYFLSDKKLSYIKLLLFAYSSTFLFRCIEKISVTWKGSILNNNSIQFNKCEISIIHSIAPWGPY